MRPAPGFAAETKRGRNTIVLRIDEARVPAALKLESRDVTFVLDDLK